MDGGLSRVDYKQLSLPIKPAGEYETCLGRQKRPRNRIKPTYYTRFTWMKHSFIVFKVFVTHESSYPSQDFCFRFNFFFDYFNDGFFIPSSLKVTFCISKFKESFQFKLFTSSIRLYLFLLLFFIHVFVFIFNLQYMTLCDCLFNLKVSAFGWTCFNKD